MTLKSTVSAAPAQELTFPCLMIHNNEDILILFHKHGCGTVVGGETWDIGCYCENWDMPVFKPFHGAVTISSDGMVSEAGEVPKDAAADPSTSTVFDDMLYRYLSGGGNQEAEAARLQRVGEEIANRHKDQIGAEMRDAGAEQFVVTVRIEGGV